MAETPSKNIHDKTPLVGKATHRWRLRSKHAVRPKHRRTPHIVPLPEPKDDIDRRLIAIAARESAGDKVGFGDYGAVGGTSYGVFQINAMNVSSWAKKAGLGHVTLKKFLNSPDLQWQTGRFKMKEYANLPLEDVFAKWNSGAALAVAKARQEKKMAKTNHKKKAEAPTVWYVNRVMQNHQTAKEKWPLTETPVSVSSIKPLPAQPNGTNLNVLKKQTPDTTSPAQTSPAHVSNQPKGPAHFMNMRPVSHTHAAPSWG